MQILQRHLLGGSFRDLVVNDQKTYLGQARTQKTLTSKTSKNSFFRILVYLYGPTKISKTVSTTLLFVGWSRSTLTLLRPVAQSI